LQFSKIRRKSNHSNKPPVQEDAEFIEA